ncbi:CobW family GTP-binding protein [Solimonas soli]|uniref:CobW family GTP-binding protein n=1 Tax=Solimonas soli TaxID=413479 RepID=UPI0004858529|nr:GTP-binding protein [Solimonas soli]
MSDPAHAPTARLPVCLLTGFLGAGKSTLLNFVLRHPEMTGTAVVINEYGAVGVDHHLVESAPDDTELIADGCLCCTASGRLGEALMSLFQRAAQRNVALKRVIIETTGLAEPGPIVSQLLHDPQLSAHFALDSVVTLVDALNAASTLDKHDIAVQQITAADRLLLSKTDLVGAATAAALTQRLRAMNPDAGVDVIRHGAARPEQLFSGGRDHPGSARYQLGDWFGRAESMRFTPVIAVQPSGLLGRSAPARTPAEQEIQTFSLIFEEPLPPGRLLGWISFLRSLCGPTLLRVKGLVHVEGQAGPTVVHGVQSALHPLRELAAWPDADRRSRLVFITRGWGQDVVASTLAYLHTPSRPIS